MSALVLIKYNVKQFDFKIMNKLANDVVANALLNGFAVSFNDDSAELILQDEIENSLLISDSFLYRHGDEILDLTEIVYEEESVFKERFILKYNFLKQLVDILFRYQVDSVNIYFTEYGESNLEEYICIETQAEDMLEKLYETFIQSSKTTGFCFPNISIHIK